MSATDRHEPMWEVLAPLIMRSECDRSLRASARKSSSETRALDFNVA